MPDGTGAAPEISSACSRACPQPLRIAHVLDAPFAVDDANGVSQVVRYLAGAQTAMGESVAVFSGIDGPHFPGCGADATRRACRVTPGRSEASLRSLIMSRYLNQTIAGDIFAWQPDVIHFHSVHVPQSVALAARLRREGISYCVTVHGGLFPAALRRGRVKKAVFNLLFERRFLREAGFVHAVSPHEVGAIRRYGFEGPVVIVPNGLPPDAGVAPHPEALYAAHPSLLNRQIFMFIGRLDPWQKGLDLLIEAFSRAALRDAALVLVGPDCRGSRRSLERLTERFGLQSRLVFTGAAFGEDRARLFAAADVFVHPSRWEGLSLSVLAAAAAGKPCLVTREADPLGNLERAEAAVIVEPTVSGVAAGLRRFATLSGRELKVMGARAKQVAGAHATWPEIADRLGQAYRSVLGTTSRRTAVGQRR